MIEELSPVEHYFMILFSLSVDLYVLNCKFEHLLYEHIKPMKFPSCPNHRSLHFLVGCK